MKKLFLFIFLIFEMQISCTKDSSKKVEDPDQIVYNDANPDLTFKTIRGYESDPNGACPPFLIPRDSSVNYELDLDKDSEIDYKINIRHYTYTYTYGSGYAKCLSQCNVYSNKQISISPVSSTAFICANELDYQSAMPSPRNFNESEEIASDKIWVQKESFAFNEGCGVSGPVEKNSFKTPYWGLYFKGQLAWIKIRKSEIQGGVVSSDSNEVQVLEWAYNKTKDKSIKAGQKN